MIENYIVKSGPHRIAAQYNGFSGRLRGFESRWGYAVYMKVLYFENLGIAKRIQRF